MCSLAVWLERRRAALAAFFEVRLPADAARAAAARASARGQEINRRQAKDEDDPPHRRSGDRALLAAQQTEIDGAIVPLFAGVFAIFGHGNVAGLGEALYAARDALPTYRAHNEQAMTLAAVAFAKASRRRRMMVCTTSIGPGATNMVTAAAVAQSTGCRCCCCPASLRPSRPDPVLQQLEDFSDGTATVNDCFRPVSRYFDRSSGPSRSSRRSIAPSQC